jgi:hypothetical protein
MKRIALLLAYLAAYCSAAVPAHADSLDACTPDTPMPELQASGADWSSSHIRLNSVITLVPPTSPIAPRNMLLSLA